MGALFSSSVQTEQGMVNSTTLGMAFSPDDRLFVVDSNINRIQVLLFLIYGEEENTHRG